MKPGGKPTLRVIEGDGASRRRRQILPTDGDMILPPVRLSPEAYLSTWVGLTSRQANAAFHLPGDLDAKVEALKRVWNAAREMEAALTEYRQVLLGAYLAHWPRAARRIMKDLQRKPKS